MNLKKIFMASIILFAVIALVFVFLAKFNLAILAMMALFTLTNASRANSFKDQGHVREARWMRYLSIVFAFAFVVVFILIFFV
ncbi:hypothetical protein QWT69_14810 [Sporosarcina oncorhynchi]|uniref:Aspartyl/asparaginyl-tRNA synthetase n=1 Tax=Sporosarcina oncorhynchi TaxID=3056444 RepID=A0ABZ0L3C8_9BACL|nr:hypothetical protein [Sporosarcina sp. T2O-4]WOV87115.1 hypothetical protein QWT69_14810 [Sporosarcina sp. T2O-4]